VYQQRCASDSPAAAALGLQCGREMVAPPTAGRATSIGRTRSAAARGSPAVTDDHPLQECAVLSAAGSSAGVCCFTFQRGWRGRLVPRVHGWW
jgi:hypothetical protein